MKSHLFLLVTIAGMFAFSSCGVRKPQPLDLTAHYSQSFDHTVPADDSSKGIIGPRIFDGVPFLVNGHTLLFGKQVAEDSSKSRKHYPDVIGVNVGRSFDELHILHTTKWPDVEGMTIARVRMNYADGTKKELDIGYGVHVRDWQRLQSEQRETVTDHNSKVVWRGPGVAKFKSSQRMFKSVLMNPFPSMRVDTIDFLSAGQIASYDLYAATVTDSYSKRPVTASAPLDRPEWKFDGRLVVRVLDPHENPIQGALIDSSLSVPGSGWATAGAPHYSSAKGIGIVRYPKERTDLIILHVRKKGWQRDSKQVYLKSTETSDQGQEITFRLSPSLP